jgi:hypothetical protein
VSLAQKDALLAQVAQHKAAMEARLGLSGEQATHNSFLLCTATPAEHQAPHVSALHDDVVAIFQRVSSCGAHHCSCTWVIAGGAEGDAAAVAAAAVAARRGGDYVPREQHEQLEIELATVKEQLIESLVELNSRELELTEVSCLGDELLYWQQRACPSPCAQTLTVDEVVTLCLAYHA